MPRDLVELLIQAYASHLDFAQAHEVRDNMGDNNAIMTKRNFVWDGLLSWKFKDRGNRSFMIKYQLASERDEAILDKEADCGRS